MAGKVGAPFGNQNSKGKGRKGAGREFADAKFLWDNFIAKHTKKEQKNILKGKYSIKDVWIVKAHAGNERFIQQIVHKLFPDTLGLKGDKDNPLILKITKEAADKYGISDKTTGDNIKRPT